MPLEIEAEISKRHENSLKLLAEGLPAELLEGSKGDSSMLAMKLAGDCGFDLGDALDIANTALAAYDKTISNGGSHGSAADH